MKRGMKPVHPGAILREDVIAETGLTITAAAKHLQISRKQLSEILNEKAAISVEMAVRLYQGFGIEAKFWLDMQNKYDVWNIEQSGLIHIPRIGKATA